MLSRNSMRVDVKEKKNEEIGRDFMCIYRKAHDDIRDILCGKKTITIISPPCVMLRPHALRDLTSREIRLGFGCIEELSRVLSVLDAG